VWRLVHHSDASGATPGDLAVAGLAARQHGVVSVAQLRAAGLGRGAVALRVRRGRLHRLHVGVYAVGHPRVSPRGRCWAALLAAGGPAAAALSHRTAAAVWELLPAPAGRPEVTTRAHARSTATLHVHRSRLAPVDVVVQGDGLALTSVARTLVDLADQLPPHALTRACHRAAILRLLDADAVLARLAELPGRRARALRASLATGPQATRSELEERFLALLARHELPAPRVNVRAAGHEVDFLWPEARLVVETDGAAVHRTMHAFETDRRRDLDLKLAGYEVVRLTWRQVTREERKVGRSLRELLARPR